MKFDNQFKKIPCDLVNLENIKKLTETWKVGLIKLMISNLDPDFTVAETYDSVQRLLAYLHKICYERENKDPWATTNDEWIQSIGKCFYPQASSNTIQTQIFLLRIFHSNCIDILTDFSGAQQAVVTFFDSTLVVRFLWLVEKIFKEEPDLAKGEA